MKKSFFALLCVALITLSQAGLAQSSPEIMIKVGHNSGPAENQSKPWDAFKEFVERESNGRIGVTVFGSASMGGCLETAEKVQMNILQMNFGSSSNLAALFPELEAFELPYLVENTLDNVKLFYNMTGDAFEGPVYEHLNQAFLKKGLKLAFISPASFRAIGITKKNAIKPSDYKGTKIRCTASRLDRAVLQSFGISPVTMSFSEVFTALQLGTVDGLALSPASFFTNKFHENLKSVVKNRYNTFFMIASINPKFYSNLPDWAKPVVDKGITHAITHANAIWEPTDVELEAGMVAAGVILHTPTDAEMLEWKALAEKGSASIAKTIDTDWVALIKSRLGK